MKKVSKIIWSCIFHSSRWTGIFRFSIFQSSTFHLLTLPQIWSSIFSTPTTGRTLRFHGTLSYISVSKPGTLALPDIVKSMIKWWWFNVRLKTDRKLPVWSSTICVVKLREGQHAGSCVLLYTSIIVVDVLMSIVLIKFAISIIIAILCLCGLWNGCHRDINNFTEHNATQVCFLHL